MSIRLPALWLWRAAFGAGACVAGTMPSFAGCHLSGPQIGPAVIEEYRQSPQSLIRGFPQGGQSLQAAVTQMASLGAQHIAAVRSVISFASGAQDKAIGIGFGAAVVACQSQDASIVQRIKDAVKQSGSGELRRAFLMKAGDASPDAPDDAPSTARAGSAPGGALPNNVFGSDGGGTQKLEPLADPFGPIEAWQH